MFKPTEHTYTVPFNGNAADAFNVARTALLSLGFEIVVDSETELKAEGPGMHSNRQPELMGVSMLRLNISSYKITATALLGGVARMKTFVYLFPPGLLGFLFILNYLLGVKMTWFFFLIVLPWVFIAPLIGKSLDRKTSRAVDRLVRGMAQAKTR
jgi:hypothetical protein